MPNIKSAMKRDRTSERNRQRNRSTKSAIQTSRQQLLQALSQNVTVAEPAFRDYCSLLDKAVKHGSVPRNTADRRKQRMALRLNALPQTAQA